MPPTPLDELVSVEPDDTLKAAAKKMPRAGVSGAPVIDASGALVGVPRVPTCCGELRGRPRPPTTPSGCARSSRRPGISDDDDARVHRPEASMSEARGLMHTLSLNRLMVVEPTDN